MTAQRVVAANSEKAKRPDLDLQLAAVVGVLAVAITPTNITTHSHSLQSFLDIQVEVPQSRGSPP